MENNKQSSPLINEKKQAKTSNLNNTTKKHQSGIGNIVQEEPYVTFIKADNEVVLSDNKNSYITLGSDRPSSRTSGYGGLGGTNSSTIDIACGIGSAISTLKDVNEKLAYMDRNFILDAARIYISEMTDIDNNFGLVDGGVGNSKAKSAIAIKADGLRFIARDGIKLVTKTDLRNSKGVEVTEHSGIDLIANNNDESLQPMVLGTNLVDCLNAMIDELDNVQNRIQSFIKQQSEYNQKIATHTHYSPFFGKPNTADPNVAVKNASMALSNLINVEAAYYFQKINFIGLKQTYLENGEKAIRSKYNRVN